MAIEVIEETAGPVPGAPAAMKLRSGVDVEVAPGNYLVRATSPRARSSGTRTGRGGRAGPGSPRTGTVPPGEDMAWAHDLRGWAKLVGCCTSRDSDRGSPGAWNRRRPSSYRASASGNTDKAGWRRRPTRGSRPTTTTPPGPPPGVLTLDVPAREKQVWLQVGGAVSRPGSPPCPRTGRPGPWFISIRPGVRRRPVSVLVRTGSPEAEACSVTP